LQALLLPILTRVMDRDFSDDEDFPPLPPDADTTSTFGTSQLPDRTRTSFIPQPVSPGTARKRSIDELFMRPERSRQSTTPWKSPPKPPQSGLSNMDSVATSEQIGFSQMSQVTRVDAPTSSSQEEQIEQPEPQTSFVGSVATYQKHLADDCRDYENELKSRSKDDVLDNLNWEDLEKRYQSEIAPKLADEQQIVEDVHRRFEVSQHRRTECQS
jgi:hypothetical protein